MLHHGRGADEQRPAPARRRAGPRATAARGDAARAAAAAGVGWLPLVSGAPRRLPRPGDASKLPSRRSPSCTTSCGERTGIGPERTILGGFSMGAVMSYALGLAARRPVPAGILAFSGSCRASRAGSRISPAARVCGVFIAHGDRDPVIDVGFAREAARSLRAGRARRRLPRVATPRTTSTRADPGCRRVGRARSAATRPAAGRGGPPPQRGMSDPATPSA